MVPERLIPGTLEWETFYHEHEQRYRFFVERFVGLDVLDAACGVGYGSFLIANAGAKAVVGIDIDSRTIAYARDHFAHPRVTFSVVSAEQLTKLGQTFDVAVSFETVEHLREPSRFFAEVRRVLRPDGLFICSTPNRDFAGKEEKNANPYHLSEMSFAEFAAAFAEHFQIEEQYHQSHSEAFRRHMQLIEELNRLAKVVRFSKLLRFENWLRRLLGKERWRTDTPAVNLTRAVPGDYVIELFEEPRESHLTFILVGRPRPVGRGN
ncbi:MAG: class I SAM-dependent methyltransferase [Gemmataceae bacterium]